MYEKFSGKSDYKIMDLTNTTLPLVTESKMMVELPFIFKQPIHEYVVIF